MKLGEKGFQLITNIEGLSLTSYLDQAGIPTIGYGTTRLNGFPVSLGMTINQTVAVALFHGDMQETINFINNVIKVKLNQNQIDALICLVYNIGFGGFQSSTLLKTINNEGKVYEDLFVRWNKYTDPITGKKLVSNGLTRRRKLEFKLFSEG